MTLPLVFLTALTARAQWTAQDSLRLNKILNGKEELQLNPEVIKKIDFGGLFGAPVSSDSKPWMQFDEKLPDVLPDKKDKKKLLTLRPYGINPKFNWDPINQKKFKVTANTWRGSSFNGMGMSTHYSNWAKKPMDGGVRRSLEEIEATGLRYNPLGERANNMAVGQWQGKAASYGNSGVYTPITGGLGASGDFMAPFTKEFWNVKGRKRRARTLEVLQQYGDSTQTGFNDAINLIPVH